MAAAAATMTMATPTHHPRARPRLRVCAAWDMNPGAATVAVPKPSKAKAKAPPAAPTAPPRPPAPTHADLFARSSEGQGEKKSTYMGFEKWWLPPPPEVKKPRSLYSAASLAYLGDCIYELYARRHFFFPPLSINEYNKRVMDVVKCESQDLLLNKLLGEDFLTQEERDILRWGRNIVSSKTRTRKRAGIAVYNRASSLETLVNEFLNCLIDARNELLQRCENVQRSFKIKKAMLSNHRNYRSSYDRLFEQVCRLEAERDNLKKDAAIYNYIQEKLQKSLPYKMIMELSAMEMEAPEMSFEELLAKEKEDTAFWQRDGKMRSISSTK